ncbi:MAG: MarR family transcriptional regulator [Pseudomonadota bacterium]
MTDEFDIEDFLPYLLNQAADSAAIEFQRYYKSRFGMLRTEWRVLFHLGRYGTMTAKEICTRARLHKTKVSRAVTALEQKRFLTRQEMARDRRHEHLKLTKAGQAAFADLSAEAKRFDAALTAKLNPQERQILRNCLRQIANL